MPQAVTSAAAPEPQRKTPATLDELMLAMDVVDTLRHQDNLVARELDETRREAELIERLREIYRSQGIDVSDRVLREGVQALKESRFVYTPPRPGLGVTLAKLWVNRGKVGRGLVAALALLVLGWGVYHVAVVRPSEQRAEAARLEAERQRIELTERLPKALEQGHAEVLSEAREAAARERAGQLLADGRAALGRGDAAGTRQAIEQLEELRATLRREYTLRIVSRPGEQTGVWRVPDRNRSARNYYLIVEAVAPDGRVLTLPVTSEEDGTTANVSKWGVRVPREVFDHVRRDKDEDGIVQRNRLGEKRRGYLNVEYLMPVLGGAITQW